MIWNEGTIVTTRIGDDEIGIVEGLDGLTGFVDVHVRRGDGTHFYATLGTPTDVRLAMAADAQTHQNLNGRYFYIFDLILVSQPLSREFIAQLVTYLIENHELANTFAKADESAETAPDRGATEGEPSPVQKVRKVDIQIPSGLASQYSMTVPGPEGRTYGFSAVALAEFDRVLADDASADTELSRLYMPAKNLIILRDPDPTSEFLTELVEDLMGEGGAHEHFLLDEPE